MLANNPRSSSSALRWTSSPVGAHFNPGAVRNEKRMKQGLREAFTIFHRSEVASRRGGRDYDRWWI